MTLDDRCVTLDHPSHSSVKTDRANALPSAGSHPKMLALPRRPRLPLAALVASGLAVVLTLLTFEAFTLAYASAVLALLAYAYPRLRMAAYLSVLLSVVAVLQATSVVIENLTAPPPMGSPEQLRSVPEADWQAVVQADIERVHSEAEHRVQQRLTAADVIADSEPATAEQAGIPVGSELWRYHDGFTVYSTGEGSWVSPAEMGRTAVGITESVSVTSCERTAPPDRTRRPMKAPEPGWMVVKLVASVTRNIGVIPEGTVSPIPLATSDGQLYFPESTEIDLLGRATPAPGHEMRYTAYYLVPEGQALRAMTSVGFQSRQTQRSSAYFFALPC